MKNGRLQVKDIPSEPILAKLREQPGVWHTWTLPEYAMPSVRLAFPDECPDKLILAKMASLIRTGLIDGCACGCRGDFHVKSTASGIYSGQWENVPH